MNPLIFLSYSSKDKLLADAICARLENQAIRCWIAPRDVKPGSDYSNQIADALESSTIMVMVFSSDSNSSRHVKSEIDRAFSLGKIIIPFRVENVELDKGLAYYLAKTHWLDAVTRPLEQHIDKLAVTISQISGTDVPDISQKPPPPPPPPALSAVPQTSANKTPWLIAGIAVFCALLGCAALLVLWMRKSETVRTLPAPAALPASVAAASPSPSAVLGAKKTADSAAAPAPEQNRFDGIWTISEAATLSGDSYTGTVRIKKNGGRYELAWKSTASTASGIALANGNKLCVAWGADNFGVVLYKIGADGTLRGKWTGSAAEADKGAGLENAIGESRGALAGDYLVKGSNPGGGGSYEGKLKITKTDETYRLEWTVADRLTKGIGIKVDDCLFVAWAEKEPFGVVSYSFEGSQAKGIWALAGTRRTATENLTK